MDLECACLAQHSDKGALCVAAHDRVVDHDQTLAANDFLERIELEPNTELTNGLRRLNERSPDVGVLHQSLAVRNARALCKPDRCRSAALGNRNDQITLGGVFLREPSTDLDPSGVHGAAADDAVGTGQVHVFEHAALGLRGGET